ncbi:MAG: hypothetical protein K0R38_2269 [Polyangiaceae bacterium]|jgi:hypothetical protein|nr:hypothetical protein [Polyangiaceae bacterium]
MSLHIALATLWLLCTTSAAAQTSHDSTGQARSHFEEGLAQAQKGDLSRALIEFQAAYAIHPHFSVLYNIGQAHAILGAPIAAIAAFEQYLANGGARVSPSRQREVRALIETNRERIGTLRIGRASEQTRIWLDGKELTRSQLGTAIPIVIGRHSVLISAGTGMPESRIVDIGPGEETQLRLPELRVPSLASQPVPALLGVVCPLPGVVINIPGVARAETPLSAPLLVPPGRLDVYFTRLGYLTASESVTGKSGVLQTTYCRLKATSPLHRSLSARLVVRTTPSDAAVRIDGQPYGGAPLPVGPHHVEVTRDGFRSETRTISLDPGQVASLDTVLMPTAETLRREAAAVRRQKILSVTLASVGAAVAATGVGLFVWNSRRYDEWSMGSNASLDRAIGIQRIDDLSVGLMILGGGTVLGGSWLFFGAN